MKPNFLDDESDICLTKSNRDELWIFNFDLEVFVKLGDTVTALQKSHYQYSAQL